MSYLGANSSNGLFGNGSDGDGSITSGTTTLTRDMYYDNLTVSSGATLIADNFRIFVRHNLVCDGTIHNNGNSASGGTQPTAQANKYFGSFTQGAAGVPGPTQNGTAGENAVDALGGAGADGSADGASARTGGAGGSVTAVPDDQGANEHNLISDAQAFADSFTDNGRMRGGASGGSGLNDDGVSSGAGGNGGGILFIAARRISGSGAIEAKGGDGGDADGSGGDTVCGGGGGGGGAILITSETLQSTISSMLDVSGGASGSSFGALTIDDASSAGNIYYVEMSDG